mmetsp:Transcript_58791/g.88710  ORF Transcript_58791/g.88710 Transcript_58791/m.88710 type:complete len:217 (-) Transcript_58791:105-755(-)
MRNVSLGLRQTGRNLFGGFGNGVVRVSCSRDGRSGGRGHGSLCGGRTRRDSVRSSGWNEFANVVGNDATAGTCGWNSRNVVSHVFGQHVSQRRGDDTTTGRYCGSRGWSGRRRRGRSSWCGRRFLGDRCRSGRFFKDVILERGDVALVFDRDQNWLPAWNFIGACLSQNFGNESVVLGFKVDRSLVGFNATQHITRTKRISFISSPASDGTGFHCR